MSRVEQTGTLVPVSSSSPHTIKNVNRCEPSLVTHLRGDRVLDTAQLLYGSVEVVPVAWDDAHNHLHVGLHQDGERVTIVNRFNLSTTQFRGPKYILNIELSDVFLLLHFFY